MEQITYETGADKFTSELKETYGNNSMEELKFYRENTKDLFTPEEKNIINNLPSMNKLLLLKAVNTLARENQQIKKDYGLAEGETRATPEPTYEDVRKEFSDITQRLAKYDYGTTEEYNRLMSRELSWLTG